jgi:hypothetical protein
MKFNNEQIKFNLPPLNTEWIFSAKLSFNDTDNLFIISNEIDDIKALQICKFSIFHTIIGDISRFDITCRDFTTDDLIFELVLEPIIKKFCVDNDIELKFDYLNYE